MEWAQSVAHVDVKGVLCARRHSGVFGVPGDAHVVRDKQFGGPACDNGRIIAHLAPIGARIARQEIAEVQGGQV